MLDPRSPDAGNQSVLLALEDGIRRIRDARQVMAFAAEHLGLNDPQAWDWPYISEKLKEARYAFSEQELKEYFTAPKVLAGLFKIIETLFEVSIRRDSAPVWLRPAVQPRTAGVTACQ